MNEQEIVLFLSIINTIIMTLFLQTVGQQCYYTLFLAEHYVCGTQDISLLFLN